MKLILDERMKHRIIGLAVIISIGAILAPALIKKSNQRFDEKSTIALKLPVRPVVSRVEIPTEKTLFNSIKIAHVEIPSVPLVKADKLATVPKVTSISEMKNENKFKSVRVAAKVPTPNSTIISAKPAKVELAKHVVKPAMYAPKTSVHKTIAKAKEKDATAYAVQLAIFTEQANAIALVNRLKSKGYNNATYTKINGKKTIYKVTVGKTTQKQQALTLQRQLASAVQIRGFVIPTGIS